MKKMLRISVMCTALLMLCSAALTTTPMLAQGGGGGGRGGMTPDAQLAQLTTALTLSADQQAKIKPMLEADAAKITALAQDPDRQTKVAAIRTAQHAAIKALLTADQATKYDAMPQGRRGGGGGGNQ